MKTPPTFSFDLFGYRITLGLWTPVRVLLLFIGLALIIQGWPK